MDIQPITYRGRTVAACTRERFFLTDELERRPPDDPELTFVLFMCAYAGDVLCGDLPSPSTNENACRYARAALIPAELLERDGLDVHGVAAAPSVPDDEFEVAQLEHRPPRGRPTDGTGRSSCFGSQTGRKPSRRVVREVAGIAGVPEEDLGRPVAARRHVGVGSR